MNQILSKIKLENSKQKATMNKLWLWLILTMIALGVFLLIIDSDQFITISVFLIFFAIILSMITFFMYMARLSKTISIRIQHSVNIAYQAFIEVYNINHQTSYRFATDIGADLDWVLVPSFANINTIYCLLDKDKPIHMYQGEAYNIVGDKQTKTYYFRGLYVLMDGINLQGTMQYRDKEALSGKIIGTFKSFYAKDHHDVKVYPFSMHEGLGQFYADEQKKMPLLFKNLIKTIKAEEFVERVHIGVKDKKLHIAIEEKSYNLPYVKKYTEDELNKIKNHVFEKAHLLQTIINTIESSCTE